jgi:hypothetical protein
MDSKFTPTAVVCVSTDDYTPNGIDEVVCEDTDNGKEGVVGVINILVRHCICSAETIEEEQIIYAVLRQLSWIYIKTINYTVLLKLRR